MSIKDILVLLDTGEAESAAAGLAADLADGFDAHLTGLALAIEPVMPPLLVSPVPVDLIAEAQAESEARAKRAVARFEELMAKRGRSADSVYAAVIAGATGETVARTCRLRDLIVAAGESGNNPEPGRAQVIEAVLFAASRPTLLVPPGYAVGAGFDTILVAWNGSLPASRAVRAGLPFLKRAAKVDVVTI
ncbi:MAG: universal stress protein, partial [Hyphomicrobiales bacterium]|nr:universal stress protein [Hyphomicrobiales bacterium]